MEILKIISIEETHKVFTPNTKSYNVKVELNNKITNRHLRVSKELMNGTMFDFRENEHRQISKG